MYEKELSVCKDIVLAASEEILKVYNTDFNVEKKDDESPVTKADIKANKVIVSILKEEFDYLIVSEESLNHQQYCDEAYCFIVDPIDGTREFIKKNGEFTINIALIHKNTPVLGVVYAPVLDEMYSAKKDQGAFKNEKKLPIKRNDDKFVIVASKSHLTDETKEFIDNIKTTKEKVFISKGSSLKLCMVAVGIADIYPRLAPTMEWDTSAADIIVRESGKMTYQYNNNQPIVYNKNNLSNPWFVVR
jgi:3'(2'), 5'-bisphosphate nucleotidase